MVLVSFGEGEVNLMFIYIIGIKPELLNYSSGLFLRVDSSFLVWLNCKSNQPFFVKTFVMIAFQLLSTLSTRSV